MNASADASKPKVVRTLLPEHEGNQHESDINLPVVFSNSLIRVIPVIQNTNQKVKRSFLKLKDSISISMGQATSRQGKTQPAPPAEPAAQGLSPSLALAAGCYWGTEKFVKKDFEARFPGSIKSCKVGFMSPDENVVIKNPTYRQVCTGTSGHIEVLAVELNEPEKHFEELIRFFFQFHDPTTKNSQGMDRGFQYASWVFCGDDEQFQIAQKVREEVQNLIDAGSLRCFGGKKVTTQLTPLRKFTKAEAAHQQYLMKNPNGYCNHRLRFKQYPQLVKEEVEKATEGQDE
jgi:peptide-methionine (S)-S-oxide reductase